MTQESFSDISDAFLQLFHAFKKHGLEPPGLRLSSFEQGARLNVALKTPDVPLYPAQDIIGKNSLRLCGVEVKWPQDQSQPRRIFSAGPLKFPLE